MPTSSESALSLTQLDLSSSMLSDFSLTWIPEGSGPGSINFTSSSCLEDSSLLNDLHVKFDILLMERCSTYIQQQAANPMLHKLRIRTYLKFDILPLERFSGFMQPQAAKHWATPSTNQIKTPWSLLQVFVLHFGDGLVLERSQACEDGCRDDAEPAPGKCPNEKLKFLDSLCHGLLELPLVRDRRSNTLLGLSAARKSPWTENV